jgi:hypothetical protein
VAEYEDRPYDAGDPKDVRAAIKSAQRWDDKRNTVVKSIMSSEDGRRWVREILEMHPIAHTVFSKDALSMAYAEGERMICARISIDVMNAAPDLYMLMMAEANPAPEQKDTDNG